MQVAETATRRGSSGPQVTQAAGSRDEPGASCAGRPRDETWRFYHPPLNIFPAPHRALDCPGIMAAARSLPINFPRRATLHAIAPRASRLPPPSTGTGPGRAGPSEPGLKTKPSCRTDVRWRAARKPRSADFAALARSPAASTDHPPSPLSTPVPRRRHHVFCPFQRCPAVSRRRRRSAVGIGLKAPAHQSASP